jgi:hypothetical protein
MNLAIFGVMIVGLTLSRWSQRRSRPAAALSG